MIIATSMQTIEINAAQLHEHPLHISTAIKQKKTVLVLNK